jgi:hypothetical protein
MFASSLVIQHEMEENINIKMQLKVNRDVLLYVGEYYTMDKSTTPWCQASVDGLVGGFGPRLSSKPRPTHVREIISTALSAFPS